MPKDHVIGILTFSMCSRAAVHGLIEMWEIANIQAQAIGLQDKILACEIDAESQTSLESIENQRFAAIICPPTTGTTSVELAKPVGRLLIQHARTGTIMCSVCGGAFILAQTGLLDCRRVTTHWSLGGNLKERHPSIDVCTDELLIEEPDLISAGGVMAWTQLGLRLIERCFGSDVMLATAKFMLIDPADRPQGYYATFAPRLDHGDLGVADVQRWLHSVFGRSVTLDQMAARARTSKRTFLRRFQKATGMNPTDYCQRLKVNRSRGLLERSDIPIDAIAVQCGYEDQNSYRKIFKRVVGITPGEYRTRLAVAVPNRIAER
ncbi:GlxA family transcriptional regulator [Rhizobium sp. Rhizsp82]|uniref:GlxA family transcriptional regulator n=1 Tax=Rhizobium sp. Rhizsp82 TaxID=3243057 RepID=UPI0039B3A6DF